jgi:methylamine utilization protein MauE
MSAALAPPFVVASLVLCVAGVLKLRAPAGAAAALHAGASVVRSLAVGEVALGAACAVDPTRSLAVALALVYGLFAAVAVVLMRRRVACGCFGDNGFPVTAGHSIASATLGTLVLAAAVAGPRGLGWVLGQPTPQAAALSIGIAGALYATVLVYTVAPRAWGAWERT